MSMPEFSNPLIYAHFNMRGGWKNTLIVAAGYGVLVIGVIAATAEASTTPRNTLEGWTIGLLVIQALTLVMYGASRVSAVVRSDVKVGLMESHRLMPTSPFSVVMGYIIGAPVQALFIAVVTFIVGGVVVAAARIEVSRWVVANLMLLVFAVMIWTLTMLLSLSTKGGTPLLFVGVFVSIYMNAAGSFVPAVNVLFCPIVGRTVFTLRDSLANFSFAYICALLGQGVVIAICFLACVKRYRRPDEPSWNLLLGLALLAITVGLSLVGLYFDDEFRMRNGQTELSTSLIASAVLCMTVSLIPLSAVARRRARWRRDSLIEHSPGPRVLTVVAVALCAALVGLLFFFGSRITTAPTYTAVYSSTHQYQTSKMVPGAPLDQIRLRETLSIIEISAALAGLAAVFRWVYLAVNKAWLVMTLWIVIFWIVPLIADTIHRSLQDRSNDPMGPIASLSPIGTLIIEWTGEPMTAIFGVVFAAAIPLLPMMLMFATQRRHRMRKTQNDLAVSPLATL